VARVHGHSPTSWSALRVYKLDQPRLGTVGDRGPGSGRAPTPRTAPLAHASRLRPPPSTLPGMRWVWQIMEAKGPSADRRFLLKLAFSERLGSALALQSVFPENHARTGSVDGHGEVRKDAGAQQAGFAGEKLLLVKADSHAADPVFGKIHNRLDISQRPT
jgi:hypothetical protein